MRTTKIILALTILVASLQFTGCKKYEEGPFISLRTKTARLIGEWNLVNYNETYNSPDSSLTKTYDGKTITQTTKNQTCSFDYTQHLIFKKDNTYSLTPDNDPRFGIINDQSYPWSFSSNKEDLVLNDINYNILRLTEKELIIEAHTKKDNWTHDTRWEYKKQD